MRFFVLACIFFVVAPASASAAWRDAGDLTPRNGSISSLDVRWGQGGGAVAVWSKPFGGDRVGIFQRAREPRGIFVPDLFALAPLDASATVFDVADGASSTVAWAEPDGNGGARIFAARSNDRGNAAQVAATPGAVQELRVAGGAPEALVIWREVGSRDQKVRFASVDQRGRPVPAPVTLASGPDFSDLQLRLGIDGASIATWTDVDRRVWLAQRPGARGEWLAPAALVERGGHVTGTPVLDDIRGDSFGVFFTEKKGRKPARVVAAQGALGDAEVDRTVFPGVSRGDGATDIQLDPEAGAVVAWRDRGAYGQSRIRLATVKGTSVSPSGVATVVGDAGHAENLRIDVEAEKVRLFWVQDDLESGGTIRSVEGIYNGSGFGAPEKTSVDGIRDFDLGEDRDGIATALVWTRVLPDGRSRVELAQARGVDTRVRQVLARYGRGDQPSEPVYVESGQFSRAVWWRVDRLGSGRARSVSWWQAAADDSTSPS